MMKTIKEEKRVSTWLKIRKFFQRQRLMWLRKTSTQRKHDLFMIGISTITMLIILGCSASIITADIDTRNYKSEVQEANQKLDQKKKDVQTLKEQKSRLQDPDFLANIARGRYYLSKPNEIIFTLPEDNALKSTNSK